MIRNLTILSLGRVKVNGKTLPTKEKGASLPGEIYRTYMGDYPKWFKMDVLCKTGVLASHLLLHYPELRGEDPTPREDTAVVLFGKNGPIVDDKAFLETISPGNYFPSPSLFVYTLSNIVSGEIAICERFRGESNSLGLSCKDDGIIYSTILEAFQDGTLERLVCGWVDVSQKDRFEGRMLLLERRRDGESGSYPQFTIETLTDLLSTGPSR